MTIIEHIIIFILSISAGVVVGTAITSFLVILKIVPRLSQLVKSKNSTLIYEIMLVMGITTFSIFYLLSIKLYFGNYYAVLIGSFAGVFIGMITAALTEVLNVIPIIVRRLKVQKYLKYLMIAIVLGKIVGSLISFLFPEIYD